MGTLTNEEPREIRNAVDEAVYCAFGSVRRCAVALDIATQSVYEHLGRGYILKRDTALKFEQATREVGHEVPAAELMAVVPWLGPDRGPTPKGRKGPKARRLRSIPLPPSVQAGGDADQPEAKGKHICPTCHKSACKEFCKSLDSFVPEYKRTGTEG